MTFFLVLATLVLLVTAQWYLARHQRRQAAQARSAVQYTELGPANLPAKNVLFHPGHTWVQVHGDGLASVGVTAFAGNFAGELASVELPLEGRRVRKADRAWSLFSKGGRRLDMALPIEGRVLAVNPEVVRDPTLIQRRPYDLGWILRIKPRSASGALRDLFSLEAAQAWIDAAAAAVTARLARTPAAATAYDGGEWLPAFGERLEDADWFELRDDLFGEASAPSDEG